MSQSEVISIMQQAIYTLIIISAPMLGVALVVGLVVSVFQAATQINEQTLSFVPKIIAVFLAMVVFGPWMMNKMLDFTRKLFDFMNMAAR